MVERSHSQHASRAAALASAVAVAVGLFALKVALAWFGGSLTLWSDAGHSLADMIFMGSAYMAARIAVRPPSPVMTWGYPRAGVLVGLLSALALVVLSLGLLTEAWLSWLHPARPVVWTMVVGGAVGLGANLAVGHRVRPHEPHGHQDLNLRSAWLHLVGDAATSLAVVVAGVAIWWTGFLRADAIGAAVIAVAMAGSSIGIVRDAWRVLMEAAPRDVSLDAVAAAMAATAGVESIHHVHLWAITPGEWALSAHVEVSTARTLRDGQAVIRTLDERLREGFGIHHATLQLEVAGDSDPRRHEHRVGQSDEHLD
ncbi:MAG: cation diffusion facilitator family transporter [Thermaerobacter sp.]|nr:cation diffusion facilitator family transporter [Thermaerobacter sp.]